MFPSRAGRPDAGAGGERRRRNLILVPAWPGQHTCAELERLALAGERPRTDYVELARAIDGDVMDMEYLERRATRTARALSRRSGTVPAQLVEAFLRRRQFGRVVARADRLGLPLAFLHKISRSPQNIILIAVWLSRPKKAVFLSPLRAHTHLCAIVNTSTVQMSIGKEQLGVPGSKFHHAPQPVDLDFWQPQEPPISNIICSVGAEARDYRTLLEALRGLDVQTELAVGTTVFRTGDFTTDLADSIGGIGAAPPNVKIHQQLAHRELRQLYARSRFVVVPLEDVEFDAGATCIAEAMAMGKAVVTTRARGQVDLVREGETGLYVPPGDPGALRKAIAYLLENPDEAERMGRAGRALAERELTLDGWVSTVARLVAA